MQIDGFLNVLKPPGMTSHDIIGCLRRIYGMKKIGHAGTLDPAAAGVLPVAFGKATRLLEDMADVDKSYRAQVILGQRTDTGDDTGEILEKSDFAMPDEACLKEALMKFSGVIEQVPPAYSAIKINGKKACDLARQNIAVELKTRQITIYAISLVRLTKDGFIFDVSCSKGTYVRSLCEDIGKELLLPATMGLLLRTRVGSFKLQEAVTLEEIADVPLAAIGGLDLAFSYMNEAKIDAKGAQKLRFGQRLAYPGKGAAQKRFLAHDGADFVGVCRLSADGAYLEPVKIFPA